MTDTNGVADHVDVSNGRAPAVFGLGEATAGVGSKETVGRRFEAVAIGVVVEGAYRNKLAALF